MPFDSPMDPVSLLFTDKVFEDSFQESHGEFLVNSYDPYANFLSMTLQLLGTLYTIRASSGSVPLGPSLLLPISLVLVRFVLNRCLVNKPQAKARTTMLSLVRIATVASHILTMGSISQAGPLSAQLVLTCTGAFPLLWAAVEMPLSFRCQVLVQAFSALLCCASFRPTVCQRPEVALPLSYLHTAMAFTFQDAASSLALAQDYTPAAGCRTTLLFVQLYVGLVLPVWGSYALEKAMRLRYLRLARPQQQRGQAADAPVALHSVLLLAVSVAATWEVAHQLALLLGE